MKHQFVFNNNYVFKMKVSPSLSIRFRVRKATSKSDPKLPQVIYCVVILYKQRCEYSTGQKIILKQWDSSNEKAKESSSEHSHINMLLESIRQDIASLYFKSKTENQTLTFEKIRNVVFHKNTTKELDSPRRKENLDYLIQRYLEEMEEKKSVGQTAKMTVRGYKTCFKWFESYISSLPNAEIIAINDLDIDFFVRYERYLLSQGTLSKNYINKLMRIVKVFFNYIYFNGWISRKVDFRISTKYVNPHRPIISFEAINQLMTIKLDTDKLSETRDLFLFQIFCGTAYVDLKNLTKESVKIIEGRIWLILNRRKTGTEQKIVLLPQAVAIIEKYKEHHYCLKHNQLLPIKSNCNYNLALKELKTAANLNFHPTAHLGRFIFSTTIAIGNGLNMESLMRAMGHKNMKVTVLYAKVMDEKIAIDFDKLGDRVSNRFNELDKSTTH